MHPPFTPPRRAVPAGRSDFSREGRDCERSRRVTSLVLFPRGDAVPGAWLLVLAATCTFVAVRALELAAA